MSKGDHKHIKLGIVPRELNFLHENPSREGSLSNIFPNLPLDLKPREVVELNFNITEGTKDQREALKEKYMLVSNRVEEDKTIRPIDYTSKFTVKSYYNLKK